MKFFTYLEPEKPILLYGTGELSSVEKWDPSFVVPQIQRTKKSRPIYRRPGALAFTKFSTEDCIAFGKWVSSIAMPIPKQPSGDATFEGIL